MMFINIKAKFLFLVVTTVLILLPSLGLSKSKHEVTVNLDKYIHAAEQAEEQKDYILSFEMYLKAANEGHVNSQYKVAMMYQKGKGVQKNIEASTLWLLAAANNGSTNAQTNLGTYYQKGYFGLPVNYSQAVYWTKKAAEGGNMAAQYNYAKMFYQGRGVEKSEKNAFYWIQKSAMQGFAGSQYLLGILYQKGEGTEKNYKLSLNWLKKASEQNHMPAKRVIGYIYTKGLGVEKNEELAFKWTLDAAQGGDHKAMMNLARMYYFGKGVQKDLNKTKEWMKLAENSESIDVLGKLAWILATNKEDQLRDGNLAVKLAEKVIVKKRSARYLDTLAAAYAEVGNFRKAETTQKEAIKIYEDYGDTERFEKFKERLKYYEEGKPWRQ